MGEGGGRKSPVFRAGDESGPPTPTSSHACGERVLPTNIETFNNSITNKFNYVVISFTINIFVHSVRGFQYLVGFIIIINHILHCIVRIPRARLMFSGARITFSVAVMWGSMGLARLSYAAHETIITCNQTVENLTTTTEVVSYIPAVESLTSEWLTTICRVYTYYFSLDCMSYLPKKISVTKGN